LQHIAVHAGGQAGEDRGGVVGFRQHHDGQRRVLLAQPAQAVRAVEAAQPQIDQQQVGLRRLELAVQVGGRAGLDKVLRRSASGSAPDQRLPDQRKPVSDQYSHCYFQSRTILEGVVASRTVMKGSGV